MQIKTTKYHVIPTRMDIIKKSENNMLVTETSHKISHIYDTTYIKCPEFGKSTKTKDYWLFGLGRKAGWEIIAKRYRVSFRGDENVLRLTFMMLTNICKYTKNHWIIHFKYTNVMLFNYVFIKLLFLKGHMLCDSMYMKCQDR